MLQCHGCFSLALCKLSVESVWALDCGYSGGTARRCAAAQVRKLEFLIAQALRDGADTVVTIGGIQSNHARATAVAARCRHALLAIPGCAQAPRAVQREAAGAAGRLVCEAGGSGTACACPAVLDQLLLYMRHSPWLAETGARLGGSAPGEQLQRVRSGRSALCSDKRSDDSGPTGQQEADQSQLSSQATAPVPCAAPPMCSRDGPHARAEPGAAQVCRPGLPPDPADQPRADRRRPRPGRQPARGAHGRRAPAPGARPGPRHPGLPRPRPWRPACLRQKLVAPAARVAAMQAAARPPMA